MNHFLRIHFICILNVDVTLYIIFLNFFDMHVSEDKTCWNDSYWFMRIFFTLKNGEIGNVTIPLEMHENAGANKWRI